MKIHDLSGKLSLFFGTLATIFTFKYLIFAIPCAIIGYIFSVIFIFISAKKEIKIGIINQGFVGMILSSVPVFLVMYVIFTT